MFHIAHLTLGWVSTTSLDIDASSRMIDVYSNVVVGFKQPAIAIFYVMSLLIIGLHLHHSIKSLFQTLGFHHENFHQVIDYLAPAMIIILTVGFISIPLAALFGYLPVAVMQ
jgi:succinate dehydrogenase / fumarate reductase cytochrome b subunit